MYRTRLNPSFQAGLSLTFHLELLKRLNWTEHTVC